MSRRKNVVLYFTPESGVTDEQASEMERIPGARQRNAALIDPEAPLEKCDAVAGPAIPENYAEAYPLAKMLPPAEDDEEEAADPHAMTSAELKAALDNASVEYPKSAKKADLVLLYQEHIGE
jgi:hypothetical protein